MYDAGKELLSGQGRLERAKKRELPEDTPADEWPGGAATDETPGMDLMHPDEIAASIRVRHIQTPLPRLLGFPRTEAVTNVRQALAERQFNSAPVLDNGQVSGYVLASDLQDETDTIEPHIRPITIGTVITGDTPLAALMPCMVDVGFLYVVEGNKISGIVTPHDLNKQPGRTYFYLLVSALELALAECIRGHFPDQEAAVLMLRPSRRRRMQDRFKEQRSRDTVADHVAAMDFVDLFSVIGETDELLQAFGAYTSDGWLREVTKPIHGLRNDVMHTVRTFTTDTAQSLRQLIHLDELFRQLLVVLTTT